MACADLDRLVILPSGDAALTRRARKHSTLSAVVLRFSRARKRHERQGLLVEEAALDRAERECMEDAEARAAARRRAAERRAEEDTEHVNAFASHLGNRYPGSTFDSETSPPAERTHDHRAPRMPETLGPCRSLSGGQAARSGAVDGLSTLRFAPMCGTLTPATMSCSSTARTGKPPART